MSRYPGVIKLDNGETIFAEIYESTGENESYLTVRLPYTVMILKNQMMMAHWIPFSDDEFYRIPMAKVITIASMDTTHKKIYATVVLAKNADLIKNVVMDEIKGNVNDLGSRLSKLFDELLYTTTEISMAYSVPMPEVKDLRDSFYSYVIDCFESLGVSNVN